VARKLGLLTVEERQITGFRNDTNIVRIVSPEWAAWLRLARRGVPKFGGFLTPVSQGGGCKSANRTPTQVRESGKMRMAAPSRERPAGAHPPSRRTSRVKDA
jgi:hypothetical protein